LDQFEQQKAGACWEKQGGGKGGRGKLRDLVKRKSEAAGKIKGGSRKKEKKKGGGGIVGDRQ